MPNLDEIQENHIILINIKEKFRLDSRTIKTTLSMHFRIGKSLEAKVRSIFRFKGLEILRKSLGTKVRLEVFFDSKD